VPLSNPNSILLACSFDDVLLVPNKSKIKSRSDVDLTTKLSPKLTLKIPLISTNMDTITGVKMAIKMSDLGGMGVLPRFESVSNQAEKIKKVADAGAIAAASVGIRDGSFERAKELVKAGATVIDVDVAHGHMEQNIEFTKQLKDEFGDQITIFAGICSTGDCADDLYRAGADSVTVGLGGGSICSTRIQTGCGVPTLASLIDIDKVAKKHKKTFMPLAGLKNSGDIVKSLAAGASAARGGNLFAGTDEAPGEKVRVNGSFYKHYNGSTSEEEKEKHVENGNNHDKMYTKHIEGVESLVPYKGPVEDVVIRLLAGVRSGFSYCGAQNIDELWEKARFIRISNAGLVEGGAHDVILKK
jgi:IMP dehydrogenase